MKFNLVNPLFEVKLSESSFKFIKSLDSKDKERLKEKISELKGFPDVHLDIKKIIGEDNVYRLRVGNFRVLFYISYDERIIYVFEIGSRENIYQ